MATFAAPRDGEASCRYAYGTTPLDSPGAHERGDGFAVRGPRGRRSLILICVWHQEHPKLAAVAQVCV